MILPAARGAAPARSRKATKVKPVSNDYLVRNTYRSFLLVSVLSLMSGMLGGLVDNIVVGQFLGAGPLAAMGIVMPVMFLYMSLGTLCASGGSILVSHALGRGDMDQVHNIFSAAVLFDFVAGGVICLLGEAFARPLAVFLGATEELAEMTTDYIRGFMPAALPLIIYPLLMTFVQIDGSRKLPLIATLTMTGSDIVMDLLVALVFRGGMFGMALATTISTYLGCAVLCLNFLRKGSTLQLKRPRHPMKLIGAMTVTSAPIVLTMVSELLRTTILNNMLVTVSVGAVAALNIRTQAQNLVGAISAGGAQALGPIAAMFYGEEDREALGHSLRSSLKMGLVINTIAALVCTLFPFVFSLLMGVRDRETAEMTDAAVRCFAIAMPLRFANMILSQYYQSTRRNGIAVFIRVLETLAAPVAAAMLLMPSMGADGVWIAFIIAEAVTLLVEIVLIVLIKPRGSLMDRALLLPDDFGGRAEDRLNISIGNSMDEVMALSRSVYAFGEERGVPRATLDKLSLCIEEMAGNIVAHSFKPGEKRWFDLLVYVKPESIILRMRDNGPPFDPLAALRAQAADDPEKNLGLRVINGITDNFEYRSGIGLNMCIMTLKR